MKTNEIIEQIKANMDRELTKVEQQQIYDKVTEWVIANKDEVEPQEDKFIEAFMQMVLDKARHYYRLLSPAEFERRHPKELCDALFGSKNDVMFFNYITLMDKDKYFLKRLNSSKDTRSCLWTVLVLFLVLLCAYLYFSHKMSKQVDQVEKQSTELVQPE